MESRRRGTLRPDLALEVVIPSFQGAERIAATLRSLAADAPGLPVIVVDDGSEDGTSEAAQAAGEGLALRVVRHPSNRGRAAARNTGLESGRSRWVLFLDDDMEVRPGMVAAHLDALSRQGAGETVFLGHLQLPGDLPPGPFARFLRHEDEERHSKLLAAAADVHWRYFHTGQVSGARRSFLDVGRFDEAIREYGFEDTEMGIRLAEAGIRLAYLPDAVSIHRAYVVDLARFRERAYLAGRVAPRLVESHPSRRDVQEFLRMDGMGALDLRRDSAFLVLLKTVNRVLVRPGMARRFSEGAGAGMLRALVAVLEHLPLRRIRHFAYHVLRDVAYYRGVAEARGASDP